MFHIQFSQLKEFFTWDELGCLARAFGFQENTIRNYVTDEIETEEDGISVKELLKMFDHKLLYNALHDTVNMHTADWNTCVFRRAVRLQVYRVFSFQELHDIRLAYELYEAADMKGMAVNQRTLRRTIKMCGRAIAPMKLKHRLKHMRSSFDEPGRIQLYEFLDLILWCDVYKAYIPGEMEHAEGMEFELFKIVDFDRLLSHYDQRLASKLNAAYVKEERNFVEDTILTKDSNFLDPTVISSESRIAEFQRQKDHCSTLKRELPLSGHRVTMSAARYVRPRPVTAPDLTMYEHPDPSMRVSSLDASAWGIHEAFNDVLKPSRKATNNWTFTRDRRPHSVSCSNSHQRSEVSSVITKDDLSDLSKNMESLQFQVETLDGRIKMDQEELMDELLPGYRDRLETMHSGQDSSPDQKYKKSRRSHAAALSRLVSPPRCSSPSHSRSCDARFRGRLLPDRQTSSDWIYDGPVFNKSAKGRSQELAHRKSSAEIKHLHGDYIQHAHGTRMPTSTLHTKDKYKKTTFMLNRKIRRPRTAPGLIETTPFGETSQLPYETNQIDKPKTETNRSMMGITPDTGYGSLSRDSLGSETPEMDRSFRSSPVSFEDVRFSSFSEQAYAPIQELVIIQENQVHAKNIYTSRNKADVCYGRVDISSNANNQSQQHNLYAYKENSNKNNGSDIKVDGKSFNDFVPYMEHSVPKTIQLGNIGKVSILESILESRLIEDSIHNSGDDTNSSQRVHQILPAADDTKENIEETYTISLKPLLTVQKKKYKSLFSESPYSRGPLARRNQRKSRSGIRARENKSDSLGKVIPVLESKYVVSDDKDGEINENISQMKDLTVDNDGDFNEKNKQNNDLSQQVTVSKQKAMCQRKIERLLNRVDGGLSNKAIWKSSLTRSIKSH